MPLIDVIYPADALSRSAKQKLTETLWSKALHWEGIEVNGSTRTIAWVYLDERPRDHIGVGGRGLTQNIYRINVRVMAGFMDQGRIRRHGPRSDRRGPGCGRHGRRLQRRASVLHRRRNT